MTVTDGVRLAVGTLTRLPVTPPRIVDRRVARVAMLLAPAVGAVLGLLVGAAAQAVVDHTRAAPLLAAALAVGAVAYLTRALHLDGLADTADALGSGRPAPQALEIARRSDIGPFGVVAVVLVLLVQAAALSQALGSGHAALAVAVAVGSGRLAITLSCTRGIPAARADGLGAAVAQSVPRLALVIVTVGWFAACAVGALAAGTGARGALVAMAAAAAALLAATALLRTALRRLGGITGDVLGAVCETGTTAALVVLALAAA